MKLVSIKLTGFKSFADLTTIDLSDNINVIVGPNGCGKSNILDAIRWVLGESSAQRLRGEVNRDFIFNGSEDRPAAARASVELLFDNSDGRVGGEFASYAELAVRRELSVDSQSNYYLNGKACRRRDVQSVFYGTGFGTRGYSIIQQDWISQLLSSDPEVLRTHLEEAADVSKYRAQRHESINKLNLTQQNLDQLRIQQDATSREVRQLKRQATQAVQYEKLAEQVYSLKSELVSIQLAQKTEEEQQIQLSVDETESQLEELNSKERDLEDELAVLEKQRSERQTERDEATAKNYQSEAKLGNFENQLSQVKDRVSASQSEIVQRLRGTYNQLRELREDSVQLDRSRVSTDQARQRRATLEVSVERLKPKVDDAKANYGRVADTVALLNRKVTALDSQRSELESKFGFEQQNESRLKELISSRSSYSVDLGELSKKVDSETVTRDTVAREKNDKESELARIGELIQSKQIKLQDLQKQRDQLAPELGRVRDKLAGLKALQNSSLGEQDESSAVSSWLSRQGLTDSPQLIQLLDVEPEWESAVEIVLGDLLRAYEVSSLDENLAGLNDLSEGNVALFVKGTTFVDREQSRQLIPLSAKIRSKRDELNLLLAGVYAAESLSNALEQVSELEPGESLITPNGIWIGKSWIKSNKGKQRLTGAIERDRMLERLKSEREELLQTSERISSEVNAIELSLEELRQNYESQRREYLRISTQLTHHETLLSQFSQQLNERRQFVTETEQNISNHQSSLESTKQFLASYEERFESLSNSLTDLRLGQEEATQQESETQEVLRQVSEQYDAEVSELDRVKIQISELSNTQDAQISAFKRQESLVATNLVELDRQTQQIRIDLADLPILEQRLNTEKEAQHSIRSEITTREEALRATVTEIDAARRRQSDLSQQKQELNENRTTLIGSLSRIGAEANQLKSELKEYGSVVDLSAVEERDVSEIEREIEFSEERIKRLGAINYRAREELTSKQDEVEHLKTNTEDLEQAINHLKQAISQVDKDTKSSLKSTFDEVNRNFDRSFKSLFGGGRASIELSEEDILQAGVIVKAQPPGKRNSTINMLSGGERAMTAIAFVFALFELNPSPVCILDEVDAPLDESNIAQFSDLLASMTVSTQFLIITHNPATMEMADSLLGITMEEAGVSRLVSVNIEDAFALAAN